MPVDTEELTAFYDHTMAEWKSHDQQHVLSNGGFIHLDWEELHGDADGSGIDWQAIFALPDNDLPSLHTYIALYENYGMPVDYQTPKVAAYVAQLGKPWFTEEFGWRQEVGDATRAGYYQWVYDLQDTHGSAGAAFWNLGFELAGGTFDVSPSTPETWATVQSNAP
jgi:endo-1,4-beta-mannosidase